MVSYDFFPSFGLGCVCEGEDVVDNQDARREGRYTRQLGIRCDYRLCDLYTEERFRTRKEKPETWNGGQLDRICRHLMRHGPTFD